MQGKLNTIRVRTIARWAEGYLELELPEQALDVIRKVSGQSIAFSPTLYGLEGTALFQMRRYEEATHPLGQAVLLEPANLQLWILLAMAQKRSDRVDLAIESLSNALYVDPKSAPVHFQLACCYALTGQKREWLDHLRRAFRLDPKLKTAAAREPDFDAVRTTAEYQAAIDEP